MSQASAGQGSGMGAGMGSPLSDGESGSALAFAAARAERRNRPVGWVMLGGAVLLAGAIFALAGWSAHSSTAVRAQTAEKSARRMLEAAATLKALREAEAASGGSRVVDSSSNVLSRIESAGPRAGLRKPVGVGSRSTLPNRELGWNQTRYSYNVRDESVDALIAWVRQVTTEVPGLEVWTLTLRPEASEWSLSVVFSRWEKAEGS